MAFRRMALSEAIPIAMTAWVSPRLNPSYEKRLAVQPTCSDPLSASSSRGRGSEESRAIPSSTVAGPARDFARRARSYKEHGAWGGVGASMAFRRMALSEAIPIAMTAWVSPRLNPSYEKRLAVQPTCSEPLSASSSRGRGS